LALFQNCIIKLIQNPTWHFARYIYILPSFPSFSKQPITKIPDSLLTESHPPDSLTLLHGKLQLLRFNPGCHGQAYSARRKVAGVLVSGQGIVLAAEVPRLLHMQLRRNGFRRRRFRHRRGPGPSTRSALFRASPESLEAPPAASRDGRIGRQGQLRAHENRRQMRLSPQTDFVV